MDLVTVKVVVNVHHPLVPTTRSFKGRWSSNQLIARLVLSSTDELMVDSYISLAWLRQSLQLTRGMLHGIHHGWANPWPSRSNHAWSTEMVPEKMRRGFSEGDRVVFFWGVLSPPCSRSYDKYSERRAHSHHPFWSLRVISRVHRTVEIDLSQALAKRKRNNWHLINSSRMTQQLSSSMSTPRLMRMTQISDIVLGRTQRYIWRSSVSRLPLIETG